ncbi:Putative mitochondrial import inner membrane translocase subunit Tim21, tim21 IMS domain superfamily [Septoria linicola]|uniref:Mitochondrial import inner membrane translocase subunit Tim21 n=1 Tax=Septoria linicola TaxID=215465 RepID=A0A9Q9B1X2_9PEZI|nr:Putative mitochondrial import inner membrane translocase subunit Tim21, tim21 IMS domain superfamily [Septoria linicola]
MLERLAKLPVSRQLPSLSALQLTGPVSRNHSYQTRNATTSSLPKDAAASRRRSVTVVNDTGAVPWKDLSVGEKAARTTQQSFNFGIVLLGIGLTGAVATVLWLEVFSSDSKTAYFNRAADRVRADPECRRLLTGDERAHKRDIEAHGEPSWSRWARNRTIASRLETDRAGIEHLHMHFYVTGKKANGTVQLHMSRRPGEEFQYQLLALDIPGEQRVYLENASALSQVKGGKLFGINWNR